MSASITKAFWAVHPPRALDNNQANWMNGMYSFNDNLLTMKTVVHLYDFDTSDIMQSYCQMLDLSESFIDSLRIAQEEETDLPSVPSYTLDSWAIEYWNSINGINTALAEGVNSNIIIGNLNGTTMLKDSSDPRFPYNGTNDSTLSSEIVSTDPLYLLNPYATYGQLDELETEQITGLYNKG